MNGSEREARDLVLKASNIIVIGHVNPDGDVVGSMLALGKALAKMGKRCRLVSPDPLPTLFSFLPGFGDVLISPGQLADADLIITLDSGDWTRFGTVYASNGRLFQSTPILNIDHHVTNELFGTVNWVDAEAAAVAEQVYLLLEELGVALDAGIATCLLTGVVSDTRCFRTSSTKPRTMMVATRLMEAGAPLAQIADWVYNSKKLSTLQLWVRALATLESAGGVVWAEVTRDMLSEVGAQAEETEDLVSLIAGVREARVAVLFKDNGNGSVRVSMRSGGEVNVAEVAAHFGGGGHPRAAGCSLPGTIAEAKETMLSFLRRFMARGPADPLS